MRKNGQRVAFCGRCKAQTAPPELASHVENELEEACKEDAKSGGAARVPPM